MTGIDLSSIEAILFDIDGTIADTDDAIVARLERWFQPFQRILSGQDAHATARSFVMRIETPVNGLVGWLDHTGLDQFIGPVLERLHRLRGIADRSHAALIPGIVSSLDRLGQKYPLGIVTAREQQSALAILEAHGLRSRFQCVATARTCRRAKPHPDPILWAVNELGVSPQGCIMVGDTTTDIRAGKAAGVHTVGVLCGFGEREELEEAGADLILGNTAELAKLLLEQATNR
jgi:phosphoglycolate phosphatase